MKKFCFCIALLLMMICPTMILAGCSEENPIISVVSIELTTTNDNQDTYTITYSDGTEDFFTVTNGEQGIQGIQGVKGEDGHSPIITIGSNGNWYIDGVDSTIKAQGPKGDTGVGILSIIKTDTDGLIDTYTITFTDNSTTTFTVTNGAQGIQGIQGIKGTDGHTPIITIGANGNWFIDGVDSKQKAQGIQGEQGLSAYEIYIKYHPTYTKTEQEWLEDLASGHLATVTLTFDTNGGNTIENQVIGFGTYATTNPQPKKDGYTFKTWTLNGSEIDLNTFTFFTSSNLVAKYVPKEFDITLNADGGNVDYNTIHITYGENYTLPTATKEYKSFANWKLGEVTIPNTGIWTYSKVAVQIKAYYNTTQIYANLSSDESYGTIDTDKVKLTVGENYELPIPTIVDGGLSFQGWFNGGIRYTDKNGQSLNILTDTATINLTANYYTEINDVNQIIAMGSAESTTGNFVLTKDLDFAGLEMTPINNFSGVFDGDGYTLKNITINKGTEDYGGFFGSVIDNSTIKNITFDNANLKGAWNSNSGIVIGKIEKTTKNAFVVNIQNIDIKNSLNNSTNLIENFGMVVGLVKNNSNACFGTYESNVICDINFKNIDISNSGNSLPNNSSYLIGTLNTQKSGTYESYSSTKSFHNIYPIQISVDTFNISSQVQQTNTIYGILASAATTSVTNEAMYDDDHYTMSILDYGKLINININKFTNNINGLTSTIAPNTYANIYVNNSSNNGNSITAWGDVEVLTNSINLGQCSYWGVKVTNNCFDIAEKGTYTFNITDSSFNSSTDENIKNSFILFKNADGSYYCFTSGGEQSVVDNITLVTKEWFKAFLSFDENIWNLDDFDLSENIYPTLK